MTLGRKFDIGSAVAKQKLEELKEWIAKLAKVR